MWWCNLFLALALLGFGESTEQTVQYSLPGTSKTYSFKFGTGGSGMPTEYEYKIPGFSLNFGGGGQGGTGGNGGINGKIGVNGGTGGSGSITGNLGVNGGTGGRGSITGNVGLNGGTGGSGSITGGTGGSGSITGGTGVTGTVPGGTGGTGTLPGGNGGTGTVPGQTGGTGTVPGEQVQQVIDDDLKSGVIEKKNPVTGQIELTFSLQALLDLFQIEGETPPQSLLDDIKTKQGYTIDLNSLLNILQSQKPSSTITTTAVKAALDHLPSAKITKNSNGQGVLNINYNDLARLLNTFNVPSTSLPSGPNAPSGNAVYQIPLSALKEILNSKHKTANNLIVKFLNKYAYNGSATAKPTAKPTGGNTVPSKQEILVLLNKTPGAKVTVGAQGQNMVNLSIPALISLLQQLHIPVPQVLLDKKDSNETATFDLNQLYNYLLVQSGKGTTTPKPGTGGVTNSPSNEGTTPKPGTGGVTNSPSNEGTTPKPGTGGVTKSPNQITLPMLQNIIGKIPGATLVPSKTGGLVLNINYTGFLNLLKQLGYPTLGLPQMPGTNSYQIPVNLLIQDLSNHNILTPAAIIAFLNKYANSSNSTPAPTPKPTGTSVIDFLTTFPGIKVTVNAQGQKVISLTGATRIALDKKLNIPIPKELLNPQNSNKVYTYLLNPFVINLKKYINSAGNQNPNAITRLSLLTTLKNMPGVQITKNSKGRIIVHLNLTGLVNLCAALGINVSNLPSNLANIIYNIPLNVLLKFCNSNKNVDFGNLIAFFKKYEQGSTSSSKNKSHSNGSGSSNSNESGLSHSGASHFESRLSHSGASHFESRGSHSGASHFRSRLSHSDASHFGSRLSNSESSESRLSESGSFGSGESGSVNGGAGGSVSGGAGGKGSLTGGAGGSGSITGGAGGSGSLTGGLGGSGSITGGAGGDGCGYLEGTANGARNLGNGLLDTANGGVTGVLNHVPVVGGFGKKIEDLKTNAAKGALNAAGGKVLGGDKCKKSK